ncbi:MAG: N-acetyltransferase, partial [Syntrophorhabdus aromaticivorans]|nr:N-acetyltransferase [Syntrophorhabdus aromaticivorans]
MGGNIHHTAIIDPSARIANNVEIGPFSIIHANVVLADGCKIGAYCELGVQSSLANRSPLILEKDSLIRSHSVFYESSRFGEKLVTGHRVTVRENTRAGRNLQIGTLGDIQGECVIGDYVRFHSNVHIGKMSIIGSFVWIFPYVVLTNDPHPPSDILKGPTVGDYAIIATKSVILPGVEVGHHSLVAADACVTKNVPPNMVVAGIPAHVIGKTNIIKLRDGSGRPAYPWTDRFTRGYPD